MIKAYQYPPYRPSQNFENLPLPSNFGIFIIPLPRKVFFIKTAFDFRTYMARRISSSKVVSTTICETLWIAITVSKLRVFFISDVIKKVAVLEMPLSENYIMNIYFKSRIDVQNSKLTVKTPDLVGICLLKVNNRNTRRKCEICLKLTIKTPNDANASFLCFYC